MENGEIMNASTPLADWILEQTTDALIYSDREGKVGRWNAAAQSLFGFTAAEALGQSLDIIIPEHMRTAHWAGFDKAVASGTTRLAGRPSLTRAVHKSGAKLYVEMTFALVKDEAGTVIGSVAVARDATERVEKERAARARPGVP
jgi:PAS domain S-box-containing protein